MYIGSAVGGKDLEGINWMLEIRCNRSREKCYSGS